MCGSDQIAVLDLQVVDRCHRDTALHANPVAAVVECVEHPSFSTDKQQAGPNRIGPEYACNLSVGEVTGNGLPALATIFRLKKVGVIIVQFVAGGSQIDGVGVMGRDFNRTDISQVRHRFGCDVSPVLTSVLAGVYQSVVCAGPQLARSMGRFGKCREGRVSFCRCTVSGQWATGTSQFLRVVTAEVRTDGFPALTFIASSKQMATAGIERIGVVRREHDGKCPRKPVFQLTLGNTGLLLGPNIDQPGLTCRMVVAL